MPTLPLQPGRAAARPFLGVSNSARGFAWYDRLAIEQAPIAAAISQRHGLHELVGRILAARGASLDEAPNLINPTLRQLMPEPSTLLDLDAGAERLANAILKGEKIAIFGDYDVDGAASSALLKRYLAAHGREAQIYIPNRMTEGYGPNPAAIEALINGGAKLIVTVDCGTTSHEALAVASRRGVDVIVVDHHQAGEELPPAAAIINPNRQDDLSGQGHLSAAGVTLLLLAAVTRRLRLGGHYNGKSAAPDLLSMLDLVALSTVCDVAPIQGVNRAFVAQGLKVMRHRQNPGLRALADAAGLRSPPTAYHLGFVLGPRINAGGRIGDASLGARLLSTEDLIEAGRIAALLDKLNRERQEMEKAMLAEAVAEAEAQIEKAPETGILVIASAGYHKGIAGLIASRLTEQFQRPSLVIAWDEAAGEGTGSARSVAEVDLGKAVRAAMEAGLLKKGGGHAMAAGVTLVREKFEALRDFLNAELTRDAAKARAQARLEIDGALTANGATIELVEEIDKAGPFGVGNPNPRFVLPAHRISYMKEAGDAHLRCRLNASDGSVIEAVAFRALGTPLGAVLQEMKNQPLHLAGRLNRDSWGGRDRVEFLIEDAADPAKQPRL